MEKKRILLVTQELNPYLIESSIAKVTKKLPLHIQESGMDIRVLMPRFGNINERRNRLHEVVRLSGINIVVNNEDYPLMIKVASLPGARLQVYFLDNEDFFDRKAVFRDKKKNFFPDNDERMIFFCKGVLETVRKFGWPPHIIHCHGWMTSLIPYYLKTTYKDDPVFQHSKAIYSVYENTFEESLTDDFPEKALNGDASKKEFKYFDKPDNTGLNLGASACADAIIKGSDKIDKEVEKLLNKNGKPLLEFQPEENILEAYQEFYNSLLEE